jgi:hypothetical protein
LLDIADPFYFVFKYFSNHISNLQRQKEAENCFFCMEKGGSVRRKKADAEDVVERPGDEGEGKPAISPGGQPDRSQMLTVRQRPGGRGGGVK